MKTNLPYSFWRRARRRRAIAQPAMNTSQRLNAFLTTIISIGMLAMAFAQWRVSEKQTEISDALAQLEFAKSSATFHIKPSRAEISLGTEADPTSLTLPKSITVEGGTGVKAIGAIDGPISAMVVDKSGTPVCDVEIRGFYLENAEHTLSLLDPSAADFRAFLAALRREGLDISYASPQVLVRYVDLFGTTKYKEFRGDMEIEGTPHGTAILYSGAWSNGEGYYFDEGEPERSCRKAAKQLRAVIAATGGKPGMM